MGKKSKEKLKNLKVFGKVSSVNVGEVKSLKSSAKRVSKSKLKGKKLKKLKNSITSDNPSFCDKSSSNVQGPVKQKASKDMSLRDRLMSQLSASRFRYINEELYRSDSQAANNLFKKDRESFSAYHEGFQQQISKWPVNPVDRMVEYIQNKNTDLVIADFGCGDAKIARSVENKVHSFDLVALNKHVTACDMSHVPLKNQSVDIAVFCLSLMGTNIADFIKEANRVLKSGGTLLIAEVVSRFECVEEFQMKLRQLGFSCKELDTTTSKMFVWLRLQKVGNVSPDKQLPDIELKPCVYNKRKSTKNN